MFQRLTKLFQSRLQTQLLVPLFLLVTIPILVLGSFLAYQLFLSETARADEQQLAALEEQALRISDFLLLANEDIEFLHSLNETRQVAEAILVNNQDAISNLRLDLIGSFTTLAEARGIYDQIRIIDRNGFEVVRVDYDPETETAFAVVTDDFRGDRPYFVDSSDNEPGELYISPLDLAREGQPPQIEIVGELENGVATLDNLVPVIRYALPIYATNPQTGLNEFAGIVITNVYADTLLDVVTSISNEAGNAFLLNSDGYYLANADQPELAFAFEEGISVLGRPEGEEYRAQALLPEDVVGSLLNAPIGTAAELSATIDGTAFNVYYEGISPPNAPEGYYWILVDTLDAAVVSAPINQRSLLTGLGVLGAIVLTIGVIVALARRITVPLADMSGRAARIAQGDYDAADELTYSNRGDEIGDLSRAFVDMSRQVRDAVSNLEARVASRTEDLRTSAEIASAANQIRNLDDLISLSVNLLRDRFDFYYAQIYLIDEANQYAVLADGTGYVGRLLLGRNHKLPLDGQSLVATAIQEEKLIVVQDTDRDERHLANPLLPDTKAELVVPLRSREAVIGVLDIQHNVPDAFSDDAQQLFQTLADQLGVTFENVRLLTDAEERARDLSAVAQVGTEAASTLDVTQLLRRVSRLTRDNFGLYHAHIYLKDDDAQAMVLAGGAGEAGLLMMEAGHRIPFNVDRSIVMQAVHTERTVKVDDVTDAPDHLPNELLPNTRSEMAVPMIVGNTLVGVLDVQSERPAFFNEENARVFGTLASQIAVAVQNARTFQAVQESQNLMQAVLDTSPSWIFAKDRNHRYIFVNDYYASAFGYTADQFIGRTDEDFFPEHIVFGDEEQGIRGFRTDDQQVLRTEEEIYVPVEPAVLADGTQIYLETRKRPLLNDAGEVIGVLGIATDITERYQAEEQRRIQLIISSTLNQAQATSDVLEAVLGFVSSVKAESAILYTVENNVGGQPENIITSAVWHNEIEDFPEWEGHVRALQDFPAAQLWLTQEDTLIEDTAEAGLTDQVRAWYDRLGMRSVAILPLYARGLWLGFYVFMWAQPREFSTFETNAFASIVQQATPVLDTLRTQQMVERRAAQLATVAQVSAEATRAVELEKVLDSVVNLTRDSFDLYHTHIYFTNYDAKLMVLAAGAGEIGRMMVARQHAIDMDARSIVAEAARSRQTQIVNDVTRGQLFLPNPLLSETRSEMAIPLMSGGEVLGVLDVQSNRIGRFDDEDAQVFETLAFQLTSAILNARLFEETQMRLREVTASGQIVEFGRSAEQLDAIIENSLSVVQEVMKPDNLVFSRYDYETDTWQGQVGVGEGMTSTLAKTFVDPSANYPHGMEALETREVIAVDDVTEYPDFPVEYIEILGLRSVMVAPVVVNDQAIGVFFLNYNSHARRFTEDDRRFVRNIALQLSLTIERRDAEAAVRRQSALVEASQDFISIASLDGVIEYINPGGLELAGYNSLEDVIGRPIADFQGLDIDMLSERAIPIAMQTGYWRGETRLLRADGQIIPVDQTIFPITDENGEALAIATIQTDISERKAAESQRALQLEIANRLNNAQSPQDVGSAMLPYLQAHSASAVAVFSFQVDDTGMPEGLTLLHSWNMGGDMPRLPIGSTYPISNFPSVNLWLANPSEPTIFANVAEDERLDEASRQMYAQTQTAAVTHLPLFTQNRWTGMILFSWESPQTFDDRNLQLLQAIQRQAGPVLDAVLAAEETRIARENAEMLARINAALSQADDELDILEAMATFASASKPQNIQLLYFDLDQQGNPDTVRMVGNWEADGWNPDHPLMKTTLNFNDFPIASLWLRDPFSLIVIEDVDADERLDPQTRELIKGIGAQSTISLPLFATGRWQGALSITWREPHYVTQQERAVYEELVGSFGSVVASRRAFLATQAANEEAQRRAAELETVARVSAAATTLLDQDELLQSVADLTRESFNLYHAHIYLLDLEHDLLVLAAGAGDIGRLMRANNHSIDMNADSIVAACARTREPQVVNNITFSSDFLPNPLLPETRSEMAIPLIVGDELIGVLDVQHNEADRFDDEDIRIKSTLAAQVAVAVRNAQAFERERRTVEQLKEVDRLKQEFLANMSHELRTPLNSIIGYSEVLLDGVDGDLSEDAEEDVEAIYTSGKHLLNIINEILDLAKIDAGQMELRRTEVSLVRLLEEIVHSSQILVKEKPVELRLVEESPIPGIWADPLRMNQVMLNLLSNAIKFTEQGSVSVHYGLRDANTVHVEVRDTGVGMSDEQLSVIFERFRQVDGSTTRRAGGTGLGLTITRQLVEMHGGEIGVTSKLGEGSTFWFNLPTYEASQSEKAEANGASQQQLPEVGD